MSRPPLNRLGIEMLTLLGMPPVEHVKTAAELGCVAISSGLTGLPLTMFGITDFAPYPMWSLRDDAALRRETIAAMKDTGVHIGLGEGFRARPDGDARDFAGDLDLMAELGAVRINAICLEEAMFADGSAHDQLAIMAELTAERGMAFTIEFTPPHGINSFERALEVCRHIGQGKARVLVDSMHFFRTGGTVEKLKAVDPDWIGYAQMCDGKLAPHDDAYFMTAMFGRGIPGEGELPLREWVAALPETCEIGLEVPRLDLLRSGVTPRDHAAKVVAAARALGA
ncbi:MAG: TIM barrel protein [Novosphingobium sp.]